jgi:hypothetical protein
MMLRSEFDYAIPFNIFVGFWTGITATYSPKGEFRESFANNVAIYWETPYKRLHFRQDPLQDVVEKALRLTGVTRKLISQEFDLEVHGKHATSLPGGDFVNDGAETTPDDYIFHVGAGGNSWFNCQHCGTANERRIIGPQIDKHGKVTLVISQTYTRISYDIPDRFKPPPK